MEAENDWERLARFTSGEASPEEREATARWIDESDARRAAADVVARRWLAAQSPAAVDVDAAWRRVAAALPARSSAATPIRRRLLSNPWMLPLAATVVIAIGFGGSRLLSRIVAPGSAGSTAVDVRTGVGERRTVELPDGSQVVLGVRSRLQMDPTSARTVRLDGEASFTVRHDAEHPFRVVAGGVVTEDVGTEFAIRAYLEGREVRVAVREGAVSVAREGSRQPPVVLQARDLVRVAADSVQVRTGVAVDRYFAWQRGELVFDDTPLADVARELSRWYGVEVRFADPALAARHLTATFTSEPVDEVLRVIGLSAEVRFERQDRQVVAYPAPRASSGRVPSPAMPPSRVADRVGT